MAHKERASCNAFMLDKGLDRQGRREQIAYCLCNDSHHASHLMLLQRINSGRSLYTVDVYEYYMASSSASGFSVDLGSCVDGPGTAFVYKRRYLELRMEVTIIIDLVRRQSLAVNTG